jgi:hypothetical protein
MMISAGNDDDNGHDNDKGADINALAVMEVTKGLPVSPSLSQSSFLSGPLQHNTTSSSSSSSSNAIRGSHKEFFERGRDWSTVSKFWRSLLTRTEIPVCISGNNPSYTLTDLRILNDAGQVEFVSKEPQYKRQTFALRIGYDGSKYAGYQMQRGHDLSLPTVEDDLRLALGGRTCVAAGRTDKGVSAISQIVSFATFDSVTEETVLSAFNANVPAERKQFLVASQCCRVPRKFQALFSATWRRYLYLFPLGVEGISSFDVDFVKSALQRWSTLNCSCVLLR